MQKPGEQVRVALCAPRDIDAGYICFQGVLAYRQRGPQWQLARRQNNPIHLFDDINLSEVDGIIGFIRRPEWAAAIQKAGIAAVDISSSLEKHSLPRVGSDEEEIGRLGASHMLERGFTQFSFMGYQDAWFSNRRFNGFSGLIHEVAGCTCLRLDVPQNRLNENLNLLAEWIAGLPKPVAVMAVNDILAFHVIEIATKIGKKVPDDLAVLGVDNERWQTQLSAVPMSSVEPNWRQIGFQAAEMLDDILAGKKPSPNRSVAPIGIATRQSTDITVSIDPVVRRANDYINQHCGEGLQPNDLAQALDISRRSLELHFRSANGQTLRGAICRAQVEMAKRKLAETDATMYQVAEQCGFARKDRFFIVFKRFTGMTPGQYRRRLNILHG